MDISELSDAELWARTRQLARSERAATADLIEHLAEIDRRQIYREYGYASMFEYCVGCLRCSEGAAYRRIRAARAVKLFPAIALLLRDGRLTLETVALLHPHLEDADAAALIQKSAGLRTTAVQALLAGRQPESPKRDVIRLCAPLKKEAPSRTEPEAPLLAVVTAASAPKAPETAPLRTSVQSESPSIRVSFTADAEFHALMRRAQSLLRHKYPDGRLEGVLRDALLALLKKKAEGFGWTTAKPRARAPRT